METKPNLDPKGCLARALPGEPMLVLLARDPDAPAAIRYWAERRARRQVQEPTPELIGDAEKIVGAVDDAQAFEDWRASHMGVWRGVPPTRLIDMIPDTELVDIIWEALSDSEGESTRDRARLIVDRLREEGR
jgi:hypothetical protein